MDASTRARALLTEAVPLLEPLLTTVSVGVIVVDVTVEDQPIRYANPAFEAITGYTADEVSGHNCRLLQGEATDPDAIRSMAAAVAAGVSETITVLNHRKGGATFWNEVRLAPIPGPDGRPLYYLGLLTDVTERVEAEQRLVSAQALHSSVFNVLAEGILVLQADGTVLDVNPAALGILGLDRSELDRPDWWWSLGVRYEDGDPFAVVTSPGTRAITTRRSFHGVPMHIRRGGDGAARELSVNYEPLVSDEDGDPSGVLVSFHDVTDRQRTLEELQQFASLVSLSTDFVAIAGLDQRVLYINEAGRALVGLASIEQARALTIADLLTEEGLRASQEVEQPAVQATGRWEGEGSLRHVTTGVEIPVRISSYLVRHPDTNQPWALATVQRDITEEQRATASLISSRERYETQFRSLPLPSYVWRRQDDDFVLVDWNAAAEDFTRGGITAMAGATVTETYTDAPEIMLGFERCWSTRAPVTSELPYRMRSTNERKHLTVTWAFVPPDLVLVYTHDVTHRVEFEHQLRSMAEHDDLTGLHNRRYFEQRLGEALGHEHTAVVIVDVDHFKFVNDSLGHGPGDDLLREVSTTMRLRLRDEDVLARLGGDEFAVLLTGVGAARVSEVAGHLLAAIRTGVTGVSVTASAGAAVFAPGAEITTSDAIVAADIALYQAKQRGRDRVELYAGQAGESLTWLEQIRHAIAGERLVLHGQPVISLTRDAGPYFELLVRMLGPDGELIPPGSFLPTAEQFGLIRDIDRWVLEHGIPFAAQGIQVSINLSARSLADPTLPDHIASIIAGCGARPDFVTFEFTETAAVSSVEDARAFTMALHELGCHTALDDFGTGFGTFVLLKHLPVGALKIDREFVGGLSTSADDQRIVRSITRIASEAGMQTVAEGVEDAGALALLREYGVGWAQGFHIARPGPIPG